jgi:hypothetical protein
MNSEQRNMRIENRDLLEIIARLNFKKMKIHLCALLANNWTCCLRIFFKRACLKSKDRRNFDLLKRGAQEIDEQLDIRNLMKMQTDIRILTNLLLTKPQRWLFRN